MITIEFYGIPRLRTGTAQTTTTGPTLGDALADLASRFPDFAAECLTAEGGLQVAYVANLGGERFVRAPPTQLDDDQVVLILSADAGG